MKIEIWVKQEIELPNKELPQLIEANKEFWGLKDTDVHYLIDIVNRAIEEGVIQPLGDFKTTEIIGYSPEELMAMAKPKKNRRRK